MNEHTINLGSWCYAILFVVYMFVWPIRILDFLPQPYLAIVLFANAVLASMVWYQCTSYGSSYFTGLVLIAASRNTGCLGVSIVYIPLVLAYVYLRSIYFAMMAILLGRIHAQTQWIGLVEYFLGRRLNAPLDVAAQLERPDPSKLVIDYSDPESMLFAASILDQYGEWERAIELFRTVSKRWPKEHGRYAANCIADIRDKIALSRGDDDV